MASRARTEDSPPSGTPDDLERLVRRVEEARTGGGEVRIAKQHDAGKMTARERVEFFLDDGSFQEVDQFKKHRCLDFGMQEQQYPGDGVVAGHGTVDGRRV